MTYQLTTLKRNKNERSYNFGLRIQELRAVIITKSNDDFADHQVRNLQIEHYNETAETIFKKKYLRQIIIQISHELITKGTTKLCL